MKNKFKTFFQTFRNSAFKPNYYKDVIKAPFSFSIKYFLFLFFFLNILTIITLSFILSQKASPYIQKLKKEIPSIYPASLEITIKKGNVHTNVQEPYFIPFKKELLPQEIIQNIKEPIIQNVLVIDTKANGSDIKKYQTFILLTKDSIAFLADRGEIRIKSLQEIKDFTLNQKIVKEVWKKINPFFNWIIPFIIITLFLFLPPTVILGKFAYLAVFSFFVLLILKILKKYPKLTYKKALQINLHAITLPTVITILFQFLGIIPKIPFFQTIILLIFNLMIFTSLKEK